MRKPLVFFEKLALIVHLLIALLLYMGVMAGETNPKDNFYLAFAGLLFPFVLAFHTLFTLFWLSCRRWILLCCSLLIFFIAWQPISSTIQFFGTKDLTTNKTERESSSFRLLSYNVHEFRKYGEGNDITIKSKIFELIKEQQPDIICFQEFYSRAKGEFNHIKKIKKELGLRHYYFVPYSENDYEAIGHAIFSRFPIIDTGSILFPNDRANKSIYADIELNGKTIRIFNVHFQSISFDKQDYDYIEKLKTDMDTQYKPTRRIVSMLKNAFIKRGEQTDLMKSVLQKCPYPFIIAGDFNDTPASYTVTQIGRGLNNAFREKGSGLGKTYNGAFPNFQIDYIMSSKSISILSYKVIPKQLSDHYPVRSDLQIKPLD